MPETGGDRREDQASYSSMAPSEGTVLVSYILDHITLPTFFKTAAWTKDQGNLSL